MSKSLLFARIDFGIPPMLLPILCISFSQFVVMGYEKILGDYLCPPEKSSRYSCQYIILPLFSLFPFPNAQLCNDP